MPRAKIYGCILPRKMVKSKIRIFYYSAYICHKFIIMPAKHMVYTRYRIYPPMLMTISAITRHDVGFVSIRLARPARHFVCKVNICNVMHCFWLVTGVEVVLFFDQYSFIIYQLSHAGWCQYWNSRLRNVLFVDAIHPRYNVVRITHDRSKQ